MCKVKLFHLFTACGIHNSDIVYGIGVSSSVNQEQFKTMKNLVTMSIHRADIDMGSSRLGFFVFDEAVREASVIHLKQYDSRADLILAIDTVEFRPSFGITRLSVGLDQIRRMFSVFNGDRPGIINLAAIVLEDSVDYTDSSTEADLLRNNNIFLGFAAIGFNDVSQLSAFAGIPDAIFKFYDYDALSITTMFVIYKDEECSKYTIILIQKQAINIMNVKADIIINFLILVI